MSVPAIAAPDATRIPLALYLHFPWCVSKCPYCDFNSFAQRGPLPEDAYVAALEADLDAQLRQAPSGLAGREIVSVFMGGGTPSLFSPRAIGRVLAGLRARLRLAPDVEITMEANPGTLERGRFAAYREAGVNRVSLGAQSFDAGRLRALGRIHAPDDTRRAAEELHAAGLPNFNLDLMYGLPEQGVEDALADLQAALALSPAHLSHYHLTLEPGTPFAAMPPAGLPDEDVVESMLDACQERLAAAGFGHYEVSAYALAGREACHNLNYWRFGDYLGVGAGAHGKWTTPQGEILRSLRPREPRRYLAAADQPVELRAVPREERAFEFLLNALRLFEGFGREDLERRTGLDWATDVAGRWRRLEARGLVAGPDAAGRCRATPQGMRFLNELLTEFVAGTDSRPSHAQRPALDQRIEPLR